LYFSKIFASSSNFSLKENSLYMVKNIFFYQKLNLKIENNWSSGVSGNFRFYFFFRKIYRFFFLGYTKNYNNNKIRKGMKKFLPVFFIEPCARVAMCYTLVRAPGGINFESNLFQTYITSQRAKERPKVDGIWSPNFGATKLCTIFSFFI